MSIKKEIKRKLFSIDYLLEADLGAGVSINPIAFLVIEQNKVKLMPVSHSSSLDKLLDYIPEVIEKTNAMFNKCIQNKQEDTEKIISNMKKSNNQKNKEETIEKKEKQIKNDKTDYEFEFNDIKDIEDIEDELDIDD